MNVGPQKIKLENIIFALADKLHIEIYANGGRLISLSTNRYLQDLLAIYNAFFYRENQKNFYMPQEALESLYAFKEQGSHPGAFSTREYKFELIVGGKDAC